MGLKRVKRPRLAEMISGSRAGETFLVPAPLCVPFLGSGRDDGRALRVFFALLWLSAEEMRAGVLACFRASLAEIRIAAGFEGYGKDVPVSEALTRLEKEFCRLEDAAEFRIFERLEIVDAESRTLEWVFTAEFNEMFVSPRVFAIVSISEMIHLKSGLDFLLYLQVRRIWKMQRRSVKLRVSDLGDVAGFSESASFQRISERVRRTSNRLEALLDTEILIQPVRQPGARRHAEMKLEVRNPV